MKKLIVKRKKEYSYLFIDEGKKEIEMALEFHGFDTDLQPGDIIYFPKKLVRNHEFYSFGMIGHKCAIFSP